MEQRVPQAAVGKGLGGMCFPSTLQAGGWGLGAGVRGRWADVPFPLVSFQSVAKSLSLLLNDPIHDKCLTELRI